MGCETAVLNQIGTQIMARNQDNQVGGFIKSQKPVRGVNEQQKKQTHNRRAGFNNKRQQEGIALWKLLIILAIVTIICSILGIEPSYHNW